jgi:hypothetical protein
LLAVRDPRGVRGEGLEAGVGLRRQAVAIARQDAHERRPSQVFDGEWHGPPMIDSRLAIQRLLARARANLSVA